MSTTGRSMNLVRQSAKTARAQLLGFELVIGERVVGTASQVDRHSGAAASRGDVDRRCAIGIGIGRRLLHLQPALPHRDRVSRQVPCFAVRFQLKPVHEQSLQHFRDLIALGAGRQFGGDIEPCRSSPLRPFDLVVLHTVGHPRVFLQRQVRAMDLRAIHLHADVDLSRVGFGRRVDGCHLEFNAIRRSLAESSGGRNEGENCQANRIHIATIRSHERKVPRAGS